MKSMEQTLHYCLDPKNEYSPEQNNLTNTIVHYRNTYGSPSLFYRRTIDYSKYGVELEHFRSVLERIKSFDKFSIKDLKISIAKTGMYYTGVDMITKCLFCKGTIANWKPSDVPKKRHKKNYATCPFVLGLFVGNIPIKSKGDEPTFNNDDLLDLTELKPCEITVCEVQPIYNIKYMWDEFLSKSIEWRLNTHPQGLTQSIANSYLYFVKHDNQLYSRCYKCLKEMAYFKGFDQLSIKSLHNKGCVALDEDSMKIEHYIQIISHDPNHCIIEYSFTVDELECRMDSKLVRMAIKLFDNEEKVKKVVYRKLKATGDDYQCILDLILDAEQLPDDEEKENYSNNDFGTIFGYTCVICLSNYVNMLFLPCGHIKTCQSCSVDLSNCPLCRQKIIRRISKIQLNK